MTTKRKPSTGKQGRSGSQKVGNAKGRKTQVGTVRELRAQREAIRAKTGAMVEIIGSKATVARILKVSRTQPGQWIRGEESPSDESWQHIVDFEYVMSRVAVVWNPDMVMDWMNTPNAFLDGARPIDVVNLRGPSEVISAINAEAAGSYA